MRGIEAELESLFRKAAEAPSLQFVFTLVRVEGITSDRDPLRVLKEVAEQTAPPDETTYCDLLKPAEALLALIENLVRLIRGEPFDPFPFQGILPWAIHRKAQDQPRELAQMAEFVAEHLGDLGKDELANAIKSAYPPELENVCSDNGRRDSVEMLAACHQLLSLFLSKYFEQLQAFKTEPTLYKLPGFEVLELLTDQDGLCGFRMHFSNGTSALFERKADSTEAINVIARSPVGFMVGLSDSLVEEWRIGDQPLYEVGLPGRYNELGTWKPLVFPGDPDRLHARVTAMSDDPDVQGALFYVHCTGHRVLEFAVVMESELPATVVTAGGRFHLYKCTSPTDEEPMPAVFVYDGWVDLPDTSPEVIAAALRDVARLMNRTALAVDGPIIWRPKYSFRPRRGSVWIGDSLDELNAMFAAYPTGADEEAIDAAIDWYNRGTAAESPFTAFLCYYIGIESLTHAVFDGNATLGLGTLGGASGAPNRKDGIAALMTELYDSDPEEFIRRAYFDVIVGATERTRRLVAAVFGDASQEFELLFTKIGGVSLTDLRSRLAHGLASDLTSSEARVIRNRIGEVRTICRNLVLRLLLGTSPGEPLPGFERGVRMSFKDPRSTAIATSLVGLPEQDWAIRREWVSWD